ncbi:Uncharacterised protein [Vibrio cholerae]|nr:Uncharacterised protein [Vibrio cholerae]CSI17258.1 Uncharacterised protein [Vibrio cholerae]CSI86851.1 Uncharacterised protein [Vibrio cholerae]
MFNAFSGSFTRHLHQPKLSKAVDVGFDPIFHQRRL